MKNISIIIFILMFKHIINHNTLFRITDDLFMHSLCEYMYEVANVFTGILGRGYRTHNGVGHIG